MKKTFLWKNIRDKFIGSLMIGAIFGGVFYYKNPSMLAYWPWLALFVVLLTIWMLLMEVLGRSRHRTIIQGRRLRWLTELGFTIENIGDYWGYKGVHHSYFTRIFYNWDSNLNKRSHELCMMVYFEPPVLSNGELNVKLLDQADAAVTPAFWESQICRMNFGPSYLVYHTPITFLTSRKRIQQRLDLAVQTVAQRKLLPIEERAVHELVKGFSIAHGPSLDYFQMAYGAIE